MNLTFQSFLGRDLHDISFYSISLGLNSDVVENWRDDVWNKEVDDHESR